MVYDYGEPINRIKTVIFKRGREGNWELGLQFNDGDLGIVDSHGEYVEILYDWKDWSGLDIKTNVFEEFDQKNNRHKAD